MRTASDPEESERRVSFPDLLELVGVTILFLCVLFRHFFQDPFYYFSSDISELYYPYWVFINHSLHSGVFPLLNPFWFAGSLPFAPMDTSVFYPPLLIAQFFFDARRNPDTAFFTLFAFHIFHYILASVAFYLLARVGLRLKHAASIFGALAFSCGGAFVGHFVHTVYTYTLAYLPLVFLFYLLFLRHRTLIYAIAAAIVLAFIIVAGHPQFVFYTFGLFGLAVVYGAFVMNKRDRDLLLAFPFLTAVFALLLAAFKVLLSLELSWQVLRTSGEFTIKYLYNSLHPLYYLTLLVPYLFGRHQIGYWGSEYPWGNWENFVYVGILPILFLPFVVGSRNRRLVGLFGTGLAVTVLLSFGRYWAPSAFLVRHFPFASTFSIVAKFTMFIHFFLAVLVAIGFDVASERRRDRQLVFGFLGYALLVGGILFLNLRTTRLGDIRPAGRPPPSPVAVHFAQISLGQARFLFGISTVAVLVLLLGRKPRMLQLILPLYALDLLLTVGDFNPIDSSVGSASGRFAESAIITRIRQDSTAFRVANLMPANINMVRSVETLYGYHSIEAITYHDMAPFLDKDHKAFLDLMNVKYFLWEQSSTLPGFVRVIPGLFQNSTVMERVEFVPSFRYVETKEEMAAAVVSPLFDPRREVVLYRSSVPPAGFASPSPGPAGAGKAHVRLIVYRPTLVKVEVESSTPGFLVFSQPRYPGWQARIDGKAASLLPADLSIYALPIDRGRHRVEFVFRSRPLRVGFLLSGATVLLLILCFSLRRWRPVLFTPFNEWFQSSREEPKRA